MKNYLKKRTIRWMTRLAQRWDYEMRPRWYERPACDVPDAFHEIARQVRPHTLTSYARVLSLLKAVEYITRHRIPGDVVECGVWRGGSMMAVALGLQHLQDTRRHLHLLDTFAGMSEPTPQDGSTTWLRWLKQQKQGHNAWCYASLEAVQQNLYDTGYPRQQLHFVVGKVEETLPAAAPEQIALLRLDTDWYESTRHELQHLYPRLAPGGILLLDDYGHWSGCRQAVDEYFQEHGIPAFLAPVDYTGRVLVKPWEPTARAA